MKSNLKFFKKSKFLPVDKFLYNVLYDKKFGYYNSTIPFGPQGDFVTSPNISNLFSEMIAIWIISTWELFGKPKKINVVELGPGDGSLVKVLIEVFKRFPEFNLAKRIYLFDESKLLKKLQKKNIKNSVKWIDDFNSIRGAPVIFFGNEFFDAIPIKQFKREKNILFERNFFLEKNNKISEIYKKASNKDRKAINSYKTLKNLRFIEFPKSGLSLLEKVINKINTLGGCILMIDYGYLESNNQDTLQSVMKHKKNFILTNVGKADITAHVNFSLLNEFYSKKKIKIKKNITQSQFLKNMGILKRAEIIAKRMNFRQQTNLYLRLKRLLSPKSMGNLFKISLAFKCKLSNFSGF
tara:strand:- start:849 stop:1907 length:1059 start_codon:yes stop_codon:yes gene_type:complete